ncbi:protein adenylyltransferase SelO [Planococcus salinarum]|uniref:protein adenylyltransferase SelO n=1 Tax=Planococcus salinarum TaxID=622695 RepID=UPI000E3B972D|nr:YdiU family protein [Planococcus salinarum]TAA69745.1 YdiU family protein [Planococcus salinarum]
MKNTSNIPAAGWNFDNSYARLPEKFYTKTDPEPARTPELVIFNKELAESLGLDAELLNSDSGAGIFSGTEIPEGAEPIAQAYAGHQFGNFTMLGDGRAVLLGEQLAPDGQRFDIQLKGSGKTAYSRGGDGRAALGPMLREYIISEAMHGLGVPTSRSLAVAVTEIPVVRESFLPGAVLTRVASSHLRFGTFQYAAQWGTFEELKALADYAIERHYPSVKSLENPYLELLKNVISRQAQLVAKWQLTGFIHGVMNTDNMTISGETIDYGPCAFLDTYEPGRVFSSIDHYGRYSYSNQPKITGWNLARFAETLVPLIDKDQEVAVDLAQEALGDFGNQFQQNWMAGMTAKLGLFGNEEGDDALIDDLLKLMHDNKADYTNTFRALTFDKVEDTAFSGKEDFEEWYNAWKSRLDGQPESAEASHILMRNSNPALIPRNHRVESAIEAAVSQQDYSLMEKLVEAVKNPYAHTVEQLEFTDTPTEDEARSFKTYCGT